MFKSHRFLSAGIAAVGVLSAQFTASLLDAAASARDAERRNQGPGRKQHKRLSDGTPSPTFVGEKLSRQAERAEGRAMLKEMDGRAKRKARNVAGFDREGRVEARLEREAGRRDNRMGVHQMIEACKRRGTLSRRALA